MDPPPSTCGVRGHGFHSTPCDYLNPQLRGNGRPVLSSNPNVPARDAGVVPTKGYRHGHLAGRQVPAGASGQLHQPGGPGKVFREPG